jgi:hypothetical protein
MMGWGRWERGEGQASLEAEAFSYEVEVPMQIKVWVGGVDRLDEEAMM